MDNLTQRLATFAAALAYEQIPQAILHHARRSLIELDRLRVWRAGL